MPGRRYSADGVYRYGFNGQEKSTELDANGNSMMAEFWQYDARLGRRWNVDPIVKVSESSYNSFSGNPILFADVKGDNAEDPIDPTKKILKLPSYAKVIRTYPGDGTSIKVAGTDVNAIVSPNSVEQFSIGDRIFSARFNSQNGEFTRYADEDGNTYNVNDYFEIVYQENSSFSTRFFGALQGIGGLFEMGFGGAVGAGASWTGVGAVAGGAIIFHGADNASAGFTTMISGEVTATLTEKALFPIVGAKRAAELNTLLSLSFSAASGVRPASPTNFVYRSLTAAEAESIAAGQGIISKAPTGSWTLEQHLIYGSSSAAKLNNPWIATSTDINIARAFNSGHGLVKIDLSKVPASAVYSGWMTLPRFSAGYHYSIWQQEVSIFGSIPQKAIQLVP